MKDKCNPKILTFCKYLDDVFAIQKAVEDCQEYDARDIAAHFKSIDLDTEIKTAVASKTGSGVFSHLTTRDYVDTGANTFFASFLAKMIGKLSSVDQVL